MNASLDTLQIDKRLKDAGFDEPQAEARTGLLRDAREAEKGQLATKADVGALDGKNERSVAKLNAKIKRVAAELRAEFALIRSEMEISRRDLTIRLGSMIVSATGVLLAAKFFG
jgi:hypothetical protein